MRIAILAFLNSGFALAVAFDVALTQAQLGAIDVFANAAIGLGALAYDWYSRRGERGSAG